MPPCENQREFGKDQRKEIFQRANERCLRCRQPDTEQNPLTLHHNFIWRASAVHYNIPGKFVAAPENAAVFCRNCHDHIHKDKQIQTPYEIKRGLERLGLKLHLEKEARDIILRIRPIQ